jgi:hypothetical protein
MKDRIPLRLRVALNRADASDPTLDLVAEPHEPAEVDFVAYGEDCVLAGRTILGGMRLSDMLNEHDEYALIDVKVERFDGGAPMTLEEIVVGRDELFMIHATSPRGDTGSRHRTSPHHLAIKMGPYEVRGFFHSLPGTDPVAAMRRRKAMVPITQARIVYTIGEETRETRVDTLIVNREQVDWIEAVEPDRGEFPLGPQRPVPDPA